MKLDSMPTLTRGAAVSKSLRAASLGVALLSAGCGEAVKQAVDVQETVICRTLGSDFSGFGVYVNNEGVNPMTRQRCELEQKDAAKTCLDNRHTPLEDCLDAFQLPGLQWNWVLSDPSLRVCTQVMNVAHDLVDDGQLSPYVAALRKKRAEHLLRSFEGLKSEEACPEYRKSTALVKDQLRTVIGRLDSMSQAED